MRNFTILLVDDELPALSGLEKGVDWAALRCAPPLTALNTEDALRILRSEKVDIVLTDIEMPNGSGLELIRWICDNMPQVKSVIYTGHAEFSYARDALRMGVEDYLLKPIAYKDLEVILSRIRRKLEENPELPEELLSGAAGQEIVDQVKQLINENISQGSLQRDELAAMVHISPGYLGRIFKKETGMALSDYITRKRIVMAKQLLAKTNLSVTDISSRVGLSYASYFTRIFKEQVGMTPQEYRQQTKR